MLFWLFDPLLFKRETQAEPCLMYQKEYIWSSRILKEFVGKNEENMKKRACKIIKAWHTLHAENTLESPLLSLKNSGS